MATLVPLAAKAPSFSRAGGRLPARVHVRPPSSVVMIRKSALAESLKAMPWFSSQNYIASKNASVSGLTNISVHVEPPSVVFKIRDALPLPMLRM